MIAEQCFTSDWQARKREELGGCDPVLLEKTIHAFALLDALAARGLEFVFKGGTSLLLRLPRIRRLSIDAWNSAPAPHNVTDEQTLLRHHGH